MKIATKHFGEVEVDESKIITFEKGIFGFEEEKKFVMFYEDDNTANGFCWMQSVTDGNLMLPTIDPIFWFPDYSPEIDDELIATIGELNENDLQLFSVVVIRERIEDMTCNLQAPVVVNHKTMKGMQMIIEGDDYGIRHNLYEQMQTMKAGE